MKKNLRKKYCLTIDHETRAGLEEMKKATGVKFYTAIEFGVKRMLADYRNGEIDIKILKKPSLKTRQAI